MHEHGRRPRLLDRSRPDTHDVPPYLVYFGIPPFLTAFAVAAIDPMAGLAMLACLTIMVIVLNVLLRYGR